VRDLSALQRLPEKERGEWLSVWQEVEKLANSLRVKGP
jgi:hypothetical protein